jgi:N-acetylmuramoyl-L-alanine amidase
MLFVLLTALLPSQVLIATPRGQANVPVTTERGAAAVAAVLLTPPLGLSASLDGSAVQVTLGGRAFQFDLGAPFVRCDGVTYPLVDAPYTIRDTLFLPLQWLTDHVPRLFAGRYHWDAALARLDEIPPPNPSPVTAAGTPNPITGLRLAHTIVVDPGHGGVDPGNPGLHFPRGLTEKDITLGIGRLVRAELVRRGLTVVLTRAVDSLVDLADRPIFCRADCDLFVSIHVNAMPPGRRQSKVNGVETYFLSDAKTEDQKRVAQMENDALRFETATTADGPLGFILRDLQLNEYLRESARLAELVQGRVARVHPGDNRGVQQGPFLVLAAARRPAILVEAGFATNRRDGAFLASSEGQQRIAGAIADGIVSYLVEFERKLAVGSGPAR